MPKYKLFIGKIKLKSKRKVSYSFAKLHAYNHSWDKKFSHKHCDDKINTKPTTWYKNIFTTWVEKRNPPHSVKREQVGRNRILQPIQTIQKVRLTKRITSLDLKKQNKKQNKEG